MEESVLKNHAKEFKSRPSQFGSVADGVQNRLEKTDKNRKSSRLSFLDPLRNLSKFESTAPGPIVDPVQCALGQRLQQLEKWKEEKKKRKKEEASKKKKPFLTGKFVQENFQPKFVPPPPPPPNPLPSTSGKMTRATSPRKTMCVKSKETTQAYLFAPKNASFRPPKIKTLAILPKMTPLKKTRLHTITFDPVLSATQQEPDKQAKQQPLTKTKTMRKPTERQTKSKVTKATAKKNIAKTNTGSIAPLQSSSSEIKQLLTYKIPILKIIKLRKTPNNKLRRKTSKTPRRSIHDVTHSRPVPRSESSSEEHLKTKNLKELAPTLEQIAKNINPFVTMSLEEDILDEDASNKHSVDHYRWQLASEIKRVTEMSEKWDKILKQTAKHMPETVQYAVQYAISLAPLLSQKQHQFESLVERPEHDSSYVTTTDLQRFWDMVCTQVENVDKAYKRLEELRLCGWVEQPRVHAKANRRT